MDGGKGAAAISAADQDDRTYIVIYRERALASYRGEIQGLAAPKRLARASGLQGQGRIDLRSNASRAYLAHLANVQKRHEGRITTTIGRKPVVTRRLRHALNASVMQMTQADAARVSKLSDVALVEEYRVYEQDTDLGPALIGAPELWNAPGGGLKGEGIVFGILDSGVNFGSPSFSATDGEGYTHTNPLGSGNYLGTCAAGGVDAGRCNDKLIGGYDYVCGTPSNYCNNSAYREEAGFGDTNGHGSHVASTAAGNVRDAVYEANATRISGVAPRANIIAYDVCYTLLSNGGGYCPSVASVAAVDQAIADGIVDVINFSIGGGSQPWNDAVSLAFLNATEAGIYVATSAGNSGPGPNTMGHLEPWTASTAASTHGRDGYGPTLQVTAPAPVPEVLQRVSLISSSDAAAFTAAFPDGTPVRVSAGIDSADDSCQALPAGTFAGAIAVVRRGTCSFAIKGQNAVAAGAVAVIIANNVYGALGPSAPGLAVPMFSMSQVNGDALSDFASGKGDSLRGSIPLQKFPQSGLADVLGSFSSRGPASVYSLIKPDLTAPGVNILAAYAGSSITGSEDLVAAINGTSMASPHHAGAAGLLRQARPDWSVAEIKSALQLTAYQGVVKEDGSTPADAFAMGAGRVQVAQALKSGLVLNETKENFLAANPAEGGDTTTLNLASLGDGDCYKRCEFTRNFRNPNDRDVTYRVKLEGVSGRATPVSFRVPAGQTRPLRVVIDTGAYDADGSWHMGKVVMEPSAKDSPPLRMPIAVSVLPPALEFTPPSLAIALSTGDKTLVKLGLLNAGGAALDYTVDSTGTGQRALTNRSNAGVTSGYRSTVYSNPSAAGVNAALSTDDFVVTQPTTLTELYTAGFVSSGTALTTAATRITWSLFPDVDGQPAGDPINSADTAVWTYSATPTAAGVSISGGTLRLNLVQAAQNVALPAGRYWLVVNTSGTFANRWAWYASNDGDGSFMTKTVSTAGLSSDWTRSTSFAGLNMRVVGMVPCGAPWMGPVRAGASGVIQPTDTRTLRVPFDARGVKAGEYVGNLCIVSNDPTQPRAAAEVLLTVSP